MPGPYHAEAELYLASPGQGSAGAAGDSLATEASAPLHVVLVHPQIPPNTGNIARLCAVTGSRLHLVAPLGFSLEEKHLRRAGLDYWDKVHASTHQSFSELCEDEKLEPGKVHLFTGQARRGLWQAQFAPGDWLIFGEEARGLPQDVLLRFPERELRVPMIRDPSARSLNLSTCAGIAVYEALRQCRAAANSE